MVETLGLETTLKHLNRKSIDENNAGHGWRGIWWRGNGFRRYVPCYGRASKNLCAVIRPNNPERIAKLEQAGDKSFTCPLVAAIGFLHAMEIEEIIAQECPQIVQTWMSRASIKLRHLNLQNLT